MATNHSRRLGRLEEIHTPRDDGLPERIHRVIGWSEAELDERKREMIASGKAKPTDGFFERLIVSGGSQYA